ncbi:MAG TPA: LysR substrate-binding domain-containing protein [Janthinobacterium sp.]|jgi:DNA-binding transcriptional LysR family regulator|nr:LysR substrate-binding domain-containing protein [Janthinobacterium sp.]
MDTLFLETLIAVIDSGTLVDAARKMNVTPGAVAQRLRALEGELGTRLVMRAGRAVRPTDAGARLALRARSVLRDVSDLRFIVANETLSGELRLGAIATALTGMIPSILGRLAGSHPQVDVFLEPGTSENLYRRVQKGELDAAIVVQPRFAIQKTLDWVGLRKEPLIVIASSKLAGDDTHELLMNHPFIRYDRNQWGGYFADRYLQHAGLAPKVRFELDALDAIAVMVDQGLGVSLVPDWAPPWPQGLSLKKLALPLPYHHREVGVIWNKGSSHIFLIKAFLEEAAKAGK